VQRVRTLLAALAVLDAVAAPPERAEAAIDELRQLVGAFPQEPAWRAKLARIRGLEAACAARLGSRNVLLAPDALGTLAELEAETGVTAATAAWRARAAVLAGPPPPAWASEHSVDARGPRAVLRLPGEPPLTVAFRHVPPGTFAIGSPLDERDRDSDELGAEIVLTRGRWLAECEVSQAVYERIAGDNPSVQRGGELPVQHLDWQQATDFAARFAKACGVPARLPTEAEWEHACRAGGLESPELGRAAWFRETSDDGCHPVGRRPPNALGLHDLLGNVWEWCSDRYGLYPPTGASDPQGGEREERVVRGGCWADPARLLRPANRAALAPATRSVQIGMRLLIDG
jgi:formylglycine-generating enzyme required for sulfatase activity